MSAPYPVRPAMATTATGSAVITVTAPAPRIAVRRTPMRNAAPGRRPGAPWAYDWQTPDDITWTRPDGTTRPGPRAGGWVAYGTSLTELRAMLRRKFGPAAVIEPTWEGNPR